MLYCDIFKLIAGFQWLANDLTLFSFIFYTFNNLHGHKVVSHKIYNIKKEKNNDITVNFKIHFLTRVLNQHRTDADRGLYTLY